MACDASSYGVGAVIVQRNQLLMLQEHSQNLKRTIPSIYLWPEVQRHNQYEYYELFYPVQPLNPESTSDS